MSTMSTKVFGFFDSPTSLILLQIANDILRGGVKSAILFFL